MRYVRQIMYREQVSWWRRRARRPVTVVARVPERPAPDQMVMVEARLALRDALLGLPPGKRAMLVLRYLEDLPEAQVADILGWRAGRSRHRATLAASAASVAGAIALALAVVLPLTAAPGPASPPGPPALVISITLSPATPARTDVLAAAAQLLRQRAAQLHLPSTRAQVSGPNVVLTGPAADETQLKTLAQGGVLNFRQVLLYQPTAGASTYGDASLVNHDTIALNHAGASAFGALTSHLFSTYSGGAGAGYENDLWLDTVAFVLDGNVVSAAHIEGPIPGGKVSMAGSFTRAQAEELAAQLRSGPLPADFRISEISSSAPSASG